MATIVPKFQFIPETIDIKIGSYTIPAGKWSIVTFTIFVAQSYSAPAINVFNDTLSQQLYCQAGTVLAYTEAFNTGGAAIFCAQFTFNSTTAVFTATSKLTINGGANFFGSTISNTSFAACGSNTGASAGFGTTYYSFAAGSYAVQLFGV